MGEDRKEVGRMFGAGFCGDMGAAGWVFMIGVWAAVVGIAVWAVIRIFPADASLRDAERALDRRFASGEIDAETYRAVHDELTGAGRRG